MLMRCIFFWFPIFLFGQNLPVKNDTISENYLIIVGDTITNNSINLNEIYILPKLKFSTNESRRRYLILKRKTIKVYPYAKLAAERLESLNERMSNLSSKRKRKKYTRMVQKYIEGEFAEKLKKFTNVKLYGEKPSVVIAPSKKGAKNTIKNLLGGLRSTCTYVNAKDIKDLEKNIIFYRVDRVDNIVNKIYG